MRYTDEEASRLILLRTVEWEALPVFATRGIAPIALFWFPWWQICLVIVTASLLWCLLRTQFVSFQVAMAISFFNNLYAALLTNLVVAIILFSNGKTALGVVSLLWHFISTILALLSPPARSTYIQEVMASQLMHHVESGHRRQH